MLWGLFWSLRRRYYCCSGPLLLLGVAVCLFYQTLMVARNSFRPSQPAPTDDLQSNRSAEDETSDDELITDIGRLISTLDTLQRDRELQEEESGGQEERRGGSARRRRRAIVLMGQHAATDTEVQLYQRVLEQLGYRVSLSRYAETSPDLRTTQQDGFSVWSILVCLSTSEKSCLRRVFLPRLAPQQRVNMIPGLLEAFSETSEGRCLFHTRTHLPESSLPMRPSACTPTNGELAVSPDDTGHGRQTDSPSTQPGLIAVVSVYVLITTATPLTAFLHQSGVVRSGDEPYGHTAQLKTFLLQQLGVQASHEALRHVKDVIGQVLEAAVSTNRDSADSPPRCLLCYQLMTFTLHFTGSLLPFIVKVDTDLSFGGLRDPVFDGQISRELVLEDTLRFLLPEHSGPSHTNTESHAHTHRTHKYGGCRGTHGLCLTEDELNLLLQFHTQLKTPGAFELLYPTVSSADWPPNERLLQDPSTAGGHRLPALLLTLSLHYQLKRNDSNRADLTETLSNQDSDFSSLLEDRERCADPHLRQLYTDPPLVLTPPFSPWVKTYRAEVPFDTVTVRIRPEPISAACRVHLDEHRGPRTANYPVAIGNSRINILVTDEAVPGTEPVAMTIYTLHMYRDSRPSLPMFGDHVMCSFVQDCGLIVQPGKPCGLQPLPGSKTSGESQAPLRPCTSGDVPGRWVVPCLSCADNRTCDWREISWQPEGCYHPLLDNIQLQECMTDKKVLFIGDSTNRGMMYFLMERVNSSLEEWGKAHNMLVYSNLNRGLTHVGYSYYPQFWLEKSLRPTFQQALEQLLHRSRPLENSHQTVLVAGGVQWLNTNHIRVIRQVLERENLGNIMVVVKSLGIGFHLPVEGIHSLSLRGIQQLYRENSNILTTAKHYGYEVIDTLTMTMGRYKEFLQGRCACHFHEVEKLSSRKVRSVEQSGGSTLTSSDPHTVLLDQDQDQDQWAGSNTSSSYHVRGPVNQMYSEILLSRLCPRAPGN